MRKKYSFYVLAKNGVCTYITEIREDVIEKFAEMMKYHYIYKSNQSKKVTRKTDYVNEKITFYMEDGCKYVFEFPIS